MIILAGVSINAVVGENGIITNAIEAARLADIADIKEQIQTALVSKNSGIYTKDDVKEVALDITGNEIEENEDGTYTVLTEKGNEVDLTDLFESAYVYVDKKSPTVEIEVSIDGNNLTVTVTAEDDIGIENYVYYLDDEEETGATGDSYEFTDLSDGSHTIKIVVIDTSGNETEKEVAVVIDTKAPTVAITTTPDTESITVEVTAEDDNGISSYEYYLDGTLIKMSSDDSYTYEGLSSGTEYTIKVVVYDNSGNKTEVSKTETTEEEAVIVGASDISENPSTYYGTVVTNYTVADSDLQDSLDDEGIEWKIFYADDENIYLIASDYVPAEYAPSNSKGTPVYNSRCPYTLYLYGVYSVYVSSDWKSNSELKKWNSLFYSKYADSSSYDNMLAVAYLYDSNAWSAFANSAFADYAAGAPSVEMWLKSFETLYLTDFTLFASDYGYGFDSNSGEWSDVDADITSDEGLSDVLYFPRRTSLSGVSGYCLASPSSYRYDYILFVDCVSAYVGGCCFINSYTYFQKLGYRPLVCLNSGLGLQDGGNGSFVIIQ